MLDETLQKIQKEELEILLYFDRFCRDNCLKYSLAYGTLIGAARHKGFIPWDDDIDVFMPRNDFEKLKQKFNSKTDIFFFQCFVTDQNYLFPYGKIRKNGTIFKEKKLEKNTINHGFFIDIFPVDGVREKAFKRDNFYIRFYNTLLHSKFISNKYRQGRIKLFYSFVKILSVFATRKTCMKRIEHRFEIINKQCDGKRLRNYFTSCQWVFFSGNCFDNDNLIEIEFENHMFMCFKNYESVLNLIYGDYKKMPPIEKQICVHEISELSFGDTYDCKENNQ